MNIHEEVAREQARLTAEYLSAMLNCTIGDDILTTREAADFLKIHSNTVLYLANHGELPGRKVGRDWRFRKSALLNYVTSNEFAYRAEASPSEGSR